MTPAELAELHRWSQQHQAEIKRVLLATRRSRSWGVGVGWRVRRSGFSAPHLLIFSLTKAPKAALPSALRPRRVIARAPGALLAPPGRSLAPLTSALLDNTPLPDPVRGGASLSLRYTGSGSLGCLVEDAQGARRLLSANHVIANFNHEGPGGENVEAEATLYSPSPSFFPEPHSEIGTLERWQLLQVTPHRSLSVQNNRVDAALGVPADGRVLPGLENLPGRITGWLPQDKLYPGMAVRISGHTSKASEGTLRAVGCAVMIQNLCGKNKHALFSQQLIVEDLADNGDSGAVVVAPVTPGLPMEQEQDYLAIGLAYGVPPRLPNVGARRFTYVCPWEHLHDLWGITPVSG